MSQAFNNIFLNKVKKLRNDLSNNTLTEPTARLRDWLERRNQVISEFSLKPIDKDDLKRIVKKMKGGKSYGVDTIDSYSIKISAPYIEEVLIHLINISIVKFPHGCMVGVGWLWVLHTRFS